MAFTPRLEAPTTTDPFYTTLNPLHAAGYGMPNCTAYAFGRFYEILGSRPELSTGDAGQWYDHVDSYERGQTPKLGAVICYSDNGGGAGHVAIVERINADGSILISQSAWGGTYWWTDTLDSTFTFPGYTFQGFIYNPAVTSEITIPSSWKKGNRYLTQSEMQNNAFIIYDELTRRGWTIQAVAALLGNMESESTINPGIWQSLNEGNMNGGFGLVQWTPASKYTNWADSKGYSWDNGYRQLQWIDEQTTSSGQWIATEEYNFSFETFKGSSEAPEHLASAFLKNFERAGVEVEAERRSQARKWYTILYNTVGTKPTVRAAKRKGYKFVLFGRHRMKGN